MKNSFKVVEEIRYRPAGQHQFFQFPTMAIFIEWKDLLDDLNGAMLAAETPMQPKATVLLALHKAYVFHDKYGYDKFPLVTRRAVRRLIHMAGMQVCDVFFRNEDTDTDVSDSD